MVMLLVVIEELLNFGMQKGINFTYYQIVNQHGFRYFTHSLFK